VGKIMKAGVALIIGLLIGVIVGSAVGYGIFSVPQKQGSWHEVTNFIVNSASGSVPGYWETAYSYPNVYERNGPLFSVNADFWRMKVQTIPYYNYTNNNASLIIYYNQFPINNIRIWKDQAYVDNPYGSIVLLDPTYDYNVNAAGTAQDSDQYFYVSWTDGYVPVETINNFYGKGNFTISVDTGVCCLKFTIEEYR
jgi:hypothetical protein